MEKRLFVLNEAPENFSVLSADGDFATAFVSGILMEDLEEDTFLPMAFSTEHLYLFVTHEESGAPVCPPAHLAIENDAFSCALSIPVGGPYLMDICIYDEENGYFEKLHGACRRHFFVGDVYLIAGQSNAAGKAGGILHESMELGVMLLRDLRTWDIASAPFSDYDDSKNNMFLHFAKIIKKETGRPVGLIPAAMGGAPLARFLEDERGDLYKKMMAALKKYDIAPKAVLWYQGCSDAGGGRETDEYLERFGKFVQNLRRDLQNEQLPFYTFQLNRIIRPEENPKLARGYDQIREAQRRVGERISGVTVFPTVDGFSMSDFIHASRTSLASYAERLSAAVLHDIYGKGLGVSVPNIASAELFGTEIALTFSGVSSYLYDFYCGVRHLPISLCDEEGEISISSHRIERDKIFLSLSRVPVGDTFVSAQTGIDPRYIIADYLTGIPMLCFSDYKVQKGN